jgi:hypothetical protein
VPNKQHYYTPDLIDCYTCWHAIRSDFGLQPILTTEYGRDEVLVICKVVTISGDNAGMVQVQSLVRAPFQSKRDLSVMQYGALLDCWHQLDRGVLAVAQTPIERTWQGRPTMPGRARK